MGCRRIDVEAQKIQNVINFITIINFDYDSYYMTLLKNALKYGMTRNDFWHNDIQEYFAYEEAYVEKTHEQNHIQGLYNYIALETICSNLFKKKGEKPNNYPSDNLLEKNKDSEYKEVNRNPKTPTEVEQLYFSKLAKCV